MRPILLVAGLLALLLPRLALADFAPAALCRAAIASAERSTGVPDRLMQAIGIVESGRPDERGGVSAWPWTINVEGTGYVFNDSVRQCGGNYGVVEVAIGHSAAVAIWVGTALIVGGVSSAIASVCM